MPEIDPGKYAELLEENRELRARLVRLEAILIHAEKETTDLSETVQDALNEVFRDV